MLDVCPRKNAPLPSSYRQRAAPRTSVHVAPAYRPTQDTRVLGCIVAVLARSALVAGATVLTIHSIPRCHRTSNGRMTNRQQTKAS